VAVVLRGSPEERFCALLGLEELDLRANQVLAFSSCRDLAHIATKVRVNGRDFPHAVVLSFLGDLSIPKSKIEMANGTKLAYKGEKFECPHRSCTVNFDSIFSLKVHYRATHTTLKVFKCDVCEKELSTAYALKKHEKTHGDRDLECTHCSRAFQHKHALLSHVLLTHHRELLGHECNDCGSKFSTKSHLERHVAAVYHRGKPHVCEPRAKTFSTVGSVATHVDSSVHRTDSSRAHACSTCGQAFSVRGNLKRHELRAHSGSSGQTKHSCTNCERTFSDKYSLARHVSAVHRRETCQCSYCDREFAWKASLTRHVRIHGDEKLPCIDVE